MLPSTLTKDRQTYQDSSKNGEDGEDGGDDGNGEDGFSYQVFFWSQNFFSRKMQSPCQFLKDKG